MHTLSCSASYNITYMTDLLTAETCFLAASPVAENVNNKKKKKKKKKK